MRGNIRNSSRKLVGFRGLKCYLYKHGLKTYLGLGYGEGEQVTHLLLEFGVFVKKHLKCLNLLSHTLDTVQFIPSNNNLHTSIPLPNQLNPISYLRFCPSNKAETHQHIKITIQRKNINLPFLPQCVDINSHREYSNIHKPPGARTQSLNLNSFWQCLQRQNPAHSLSEMPRKASSLETD